MSLGFCDGSVRVALCAHGVRVERSRWTIDTVTAGRSRPGSTLADMVDLPVNPADEIAVDNRPQLDLSFGDSAQLGKV